MCFTTSHGCQFIIIVIYHFLVIRLVCNFSDIYIKCLSGFTGKNICNSQNYINLQLNISSKYQYNINFLLLHKRLSTILCMYFYLDLIMEAVIDNHSLVTKANGPILVGINKNIRDVISFPCFTLYEH